MMYQSQYPGKFTLPSGVELSLGDTGEADPENLGISMAVADGWLVPIDPPPVAAKGKKE